MLTAGLRMVDQLPLGASMLIPVRDGTVLAAYDGRVVALMVGAAR